MFYNVTLEDFRPWNTWKPTYDPQDIHIGHLNKFVTDGQEHREYLELYTPALWEKCVKLSFFTMPIHLMATIVNTAYRIAKLVTFANFWMSKPENANTFGARCKDTAADVVRLFIFPLTILCLQLSAIYGIYSPDNGRKLYATFERVQYGAPVAAFCFQPKLKNNKGWQHSVAGFCRYLEKCTRPKLKEEI